jgi:hypothetical protein
MHHTNLKPDANCSSYLLDYIWLLPLREAVSAQSEFSPVYTYYYSYKGEFTLTRVLLALQGKYPIAVEFLIHKISEWFEKTILGKEIVHHGKGRI